MQKCEIAKFVTMSCFLLMHLPMHGKNNIAIRSKRYNNDDKNRARNFSEIISNVTRAHRDVTKALSNIAVSDFYFNLVQVRSLTKYF